MMSPLSEDVEDGRAALKAEPDDAPLRKLVAELERSNAELEQFAYMVSHDLREPLRMVTSYAQLLERRCAGQLDAEATEFLHYLTDGARRMDQMIQDILCFARAGQNMDLAPVDSRAAVGAALVDLGRAIEETGGTITIGTMPTIIADRVQIERLFENLIGNALKYHRPGLKPIVHVEGAVTIDGWIFTVADNGEGIAPADRDKVFSVFERLHGREVPGTGLGLAICKKIVERHGGRIWVDSTPGEGSTFTFTLARPLDACRGQN